MLNQNMLFYGEIRLNPIEWMEGLIFEEDSESFFIQIHGLHADECFDVLPI